MVASKSLWPPLTALLHRGAASAGRQETAGRPGEGLGLGFLGVISGVISPLMQVITIYYI